MRFLVRLLGGIWLATLLVSAGFAYLEVREERARLVEDLKRRAALVGYTVSQASESLVARGGNKNGLERVLARFGRPDRPIAIYDAFGSVLAAPSGAPSARWPPGCPASRAPSGAPATSPSRRRAPASPARVYGRRSGSSSSWRRASDGGRSSSSRIASR